MRVADATDETYETLTANGTVVVTLYFSTHPGYEDQNPKEQKSAVVPGMTFKLRKRRYSGDMRRALKNALWECDRKARLVFVQVEQCPATRNRLDLGAFPAFLILKDGVRIADKFGMFQGGHRDSYRLARDEFVKWLHQHLS